VSARNDDATKSNYITFKSILNFSDNGELQLTLLSFWTLSILF